MSMRDEIHIPEDDLIQYAMGVLPDGQLNSLTAHISLCNVCRDELAKTQVALAAYATVYATGQPMTDVPAGARERFLAQLNTGKGESKLVQMRNKNRAYQASRAFKEWLESPMPLKIFAGALAATLLFAVYDDLNHIHELRRLRPEINRFEAESAQLDELKQFLKGADAKQISLREKPSVVKSPEGHALYSAASGKLIFTASNMPKPPDGKAYELWILPASGAAPVPAGMFSPDMQGNAAVIFPAIPMNVQAEGFGVTVEVEGGVKSPTPPIVLSGQ
jgi:anti-sigma-K factor RskA